MVSFLTISTFKEQLIELMWSTSLIFDGYQHARPAALIAPMFACLTVCFPEHL